MLEWGSFITGLVGALIGGGASFSVQAYVSRREWKGRRLAAVARIDAAMRGLVREGAGRSAVDRNTTKFLDAMLESRAAIIELRLVLKPREIIVAEWLDQRRVFVTQRAGTDSVEDAIAVVPEVEKSLVMLTEWATGQRKAKTFLAMTTTT